MDLERLLALLPPEPAPQPAGDLLSLPSSFRQVVRELGGVTLGGLYRVLPEGGVRSCTGMVREAFPEFADRAVPFGIDWLGSTRRSGYSDSYLNDNWILVR